MSWIQKSWLISTVVTSYCVLSPLTQAQVIPDGTTPNTNAVGDCLARCEITGGIQAESNLFHSFQEFNIGAGESIYFVDPGVANIFTRITGGNSSEIFGTLGVSGDANLWLLNPQGILFGNGATLDINGSFVATTADEIVFGDRGSFSANPDNSESLPLLTVNPSALFARQMSQANGIEIKETSLVLPNQENLILIGSQHNESNNSVLIEDATITAPQGNIQLGAIADSEIIEISPDLQLQFPQEIVGGNIILDRGSDLNVNGIGGGSITVRSAKLNIIDNSVIRSGTLGNIDSGDINITTRDINIDKGLIHTLSLGTGKSSDINIKTDNLNILGNGVVNYQISIEKALQGSLSQEDEVSGIVTSTNNIGAAGKITIDSDNISARDGGFIGTITYHGGQGGNIEIANTETIDIASSGVLSLSAFESIGDTGNLNLKTQKLFVRDGGIVSTATLGRGVGGEINIQATDSVELFGTSVNYILPTSIFTNSVFKDSGKAGNIEIATGNLTIKDGSQISSASGLLTNQGIVPFGGDGGNINIRATESISISGSSANGIFPSSILSDTRSNNPAGNITIDTGAFLIEGKASVSASSIGTGDGGNLTIDARESIRLESQELDNFLKLINISTSSKEVSFFDAKGGLFSFSIDGNGGNINLQTPTLSLNNGSLITSATLGQGKGGDINIETSNTVKIITSLIASSSLNTGDAGDLTLKTSNLIIKNGANLATATVGSGKAGNMTIEARESVELSNSKDFNLPIQGGILTNNSGGELGSAGNLQLDTKKLLIKDGLSINIANIALFSVETDNNNLEIANNPLPIDSEPESSIINATESIEVSGSSFSGEFISGIPSATNTKAPANNLQLNTPQLTVSEGAYISVNSLGQGAAGTLDIVADKIYLESGGTLNASTLSGKGGNINLQLKDTLQLKDRSMITTNAFNQGNGGNINIEAQFAIAFPNSSITANAIAGKGGNINLKTQDIFMASPHQISASSQLGIDGEVKISTFTSDLRNNLAKLPEKIERREQRIVSSCGVDDEYGASSFVYVGKGALSPSPLEGKIDNETFVIDWGTDTTELQLYPIPKSPDSTVIEATALGISDRGNPSLIAQETPRNLALFDPAECPFKQ